MTQHEEMELDRQLCFALHRASRAVVRSYGPLLRASGLTYTQYLVMLVLWESPSRPSTVSEIGARLDLDSGTLTPLLKRLEALGHVRRRRDTADERRVMVDLTERGLALRDEVAEVPDQLAATLATDQEEADRLRDDLVRLLDHLKPAPPS